MFNLLRADLWRLFNTNRLRGQFWSYLAGGILVALFVFGLLAFVNSDGYAELAASMDAEPATDDTSTAISALPVTAMLANAFVSGGFFSLMCCFCAAEFTLADLKAGYLKNIVSSTRGKLAYFAEKLVFCGIMCAVLLVIISAACLLYAFVFQLVPSGESIARIAGWLILTWLNGWTFAVLTVAAAWIVRGPALVYIWGIVLSAGSLRELVMGLAYSSGGMLNVLQPIAPALKALASWMPSSATQLLSQGSAVFDMPMTVDGISIFSGMGASGTALPLGADVQVLITNVAWIALASALALIASRKMDVA